MTRLFLLTSLAACLAAPAEAAEGAWIAIDRSDKCEMVPDGGWGRDRFFDRIGCMPPGGSHYHCPGGPAILHDTDRWRMRCTPRRNVAVRAVESLEGFIRVDGPKGLVTVRDLTKLAAEGFAVVEEKRAPSGGRVFLRIVFFPLWSVANLEWNVAEPLTREYLARNANTPPVELSKEESYEALVAIAERVETELVMSRKPDPALLEKLAPQVEERLKAMGRELKELQ